ncbi:MFS transporter [Nocardia nova]|uniref:Putative proline/betaine transporter n=1 Tax=Nocardia nova TaxID=37330 RepID=A0A2S6AN55_9NOCA|nr:MFS transporter [Nocardia nova]PPJ25708.1 MFS transporter [Nocardia nova]PPJ36665.1 MFS transporter [Nocardia nova]
MTGTLTEGEGGGGSTEPALRSGGTGPISQRPARVIRAAILGTAVEYYDFGIYGYMATIMAANFFREGNQTAALLATFATFAVAFLVRIPGGIFFGHVGDKFGRKRALTWTILLMSGATAAIAILPTYATLGIWSAVLLIAIRCVQGFAAGGEIAGANTFVAENAPARWRAFQTSFVNSGTYFGSLLASTLALILATTVSEDTLNSWAWRIPFLLSIPIGVIGFWIRSTLDDTSQFDALMKAETVHVEKVPIEELFRSNRREILIIIGLGGAVTGGYYVSSVFAASYLQTAGGHSAKFAFLSTSIALVAGAITLPISGYLGDVVGRKLVLLIGSTSSVVLAFPLFLLIAHGSPIFAIFGHVVLVVLVSLVNGCSLVTYVEMLRARVRYSGIAFCNNVSNTLLGGTAPFIATLLISWTGSKAAPAGYFMFCVALTAVAALFVRETRGMELQL